MYEFESNRKYAKKVQYKKVEETVRKKVFNSDGEKPSKPDKTLKNNNSRLEKTEEENTKKRIAKSKIANVFFLEISFSANRNR